ncbi:tRNA (adenosine(37)-N6)-threonylcarbamoyltransferase complex dimerization subunit type 1 TsaB [Paenibacillus piri]|uniref:tRNA (Adenosine(37)-N6)-threonylcarbamoyltransferase complex dimerization subunit type 1 TsaB n=1 Tax=Paenibacillus piri TaxID=2547395 RepID=A0A4R5KFV7_9BACL|nr:tRNA (adenosine(37)-N6)-threonylcarbamoyltransferase complex dimerization subunit type 1 TsaB [Paenibacillus piri]TDF93872.1 tRNA (adenosine(37)-N6)-threonylcarbamoyltransferase complex dimerization subunit type 1 TsaB [Paenibacillus piri]
MTSITKMNAADGMLLAVDTSSSAMSIALTRGPELLGELNSKAERNHSIHLLPAIRQLLSDAGLHPRDLDAFAVGVGPGSYTGVRIGVTVAKTFAWTHDMALLGVSSLEALALGGGEAYFREAAGDSGEANVSSAEEALGRRNETVWFVPMFEARRGQAFTALYQASPQSWSCLVQDGIRLMSSWTEELLKRSAETASGESAAAKPDRIVFVGETGLHTETLDRFFTAWAGPSGVVDHEMRARHIAQIGRRHWREGRIEQAHGLVPNYTQLTEAEVNLAKKSQGGP